MTKLPFYEEHNNCTVYFIEIDEDNGEDIDDYTPEELAEACDFWYDLGVGKIEIDWLNTNVYSVTVYDD
jgi:hypothetical protein